MRRDARQREARTVRVGLLVLAALGSLAVLIFLLGEKSQLFRSKNRYHIRIENVQGLQAGNPVQLSGVNVGRVDEILLPEDPGEHLLVVGLSVDARYGGRIRQDSQAGIKTLGLLGDKYVAITSGSPGSKPIPDGGEIPAAEATDVDRLFASGEDVVENILLISHSLVQVVQRLERGEGVLGQLLMKDPQGRDVNESVFAILRSVERIADRVDATTDELTAGQGPLARLFNDPQMADDLARSLERLQRLLGAAEAGEGLLPGLLNDPAMRQRFTTLLTNLESATDRLATAGDALAGDEALLPRLLNDREYGRRVSEELRQLLERLNGATERLVEGDGTISHLINDREVYDAINDVLVGIDESWMLRWLIRNRQKAGIETRYEETRDEGDRAAPPPPAPPGGGG